MWRPVTCDWENKFVCKWNASPLPTPPPPGDCPEGWEDIGGEKCYMHQDFPVQQTEKNIHSVNKKYLQSSWHEASTACWQEIGAEGRHGNLASIHSQEENDLLAAWLASRNSPDPWIGATQDTCGTSLINITALVRAGPGAGRQHQLDGRVRAGLRELG